MPSENPNNHESRLVGDKGISNKVVPLSVKLPDEIDKILRSLKFPPKETRSGYLRKTIISQMLIDGHITEEMAVRSLNPPKIPVPKKKKSTPIAEQTIQMSKSILAHGKLEPDTSQI